MWKESSLVVLIGILLFTGCGKKNPTDGSNSNHPPYTPGNLIYSPSDGATGVVTSAQLNWSGGDPDAGSTVKYTVYFGTQSPPPLVSSDQSNTTYNPGTMIGATTYYWKVMAKDNFGVTATSPVWSFETYGAHRNEWNWTNSSWSTLPGNYTYLGPYSLNAGDSLNITVTNVSSNTGGLFCCTAQDFANWQAGNTSYSIFSVNGSTGGTWKVCVSSTDNYYFVNDNTSSIVTTVTFDLKVDVIRWAWYK
ncbi:MAG: hypothetical protein WC614_01580 [bacterium]